MFKRFQKYSAAIPVLLGSILLVSVPVFAAPPNPAPTGPSNPTNFQLTSLTLASQVQGQVDFSVTVDQTSPDGSDFGTSNTEFHAFPNTIYVSFDGSGNTGSSTYYPATIFSSDKGVGISYNKSGKGPVAATVEYSVRFPSTLSQSGSYTLKIYQPGSYTGPSPSSNDQQYAFRMGPPYTQGGQPPTADGSWSDDLVWMGQYTSWPNLPASSIPTGQLPEVPYAGLLPVVGVVGAGIGIWVRRKRSV